MKWEYLVAQQATQPGQAWNFFPVTAPYSNLVTESRSNVLDALGNDGWELVSRTYVDEQNEFIFKRPTER